HLITYALILFFSSLLPHHPTSPPFPYTTLFRSTPPAVVGSEYVLFAQLKAKDIFDSAVFAEVKQAVDKAGGTAEWDKAEQEKTGSEEHTSELQSRGHLVCRLLLEKKKKQ